MRALAFLAVFLHHAFRVPMLWWGVDLFFAMSEFLITGILLQQSRDGGYFSSFYIRRAFRILPRYVLVVAVAMLYFPGDRATLPWYLTFFSNVLFVLRPGGQHFAVLVPTWSLSVEEQFYLLWPLLVFVTPVRHFWRVAVLAIVAALLMRVGADPRHSPTLGRVLPVAHPHRRSRRRCTPGMALLHSAAET